jgi:hypothetical protein
VKVLVEVRCTPTGMLLAELGRDDDGALVLVSRARLRAATHDLDVEGVARNVRTTRERRDVLPVDPRRATAGQLLIALYGCLDKAKHWHQVDVTLLASHLNEAERTGEIRTLRLAAP